MNWYSVFYWLTVSEGVKDFFDVSSNIFTWFTVLSFIALVVVTIGKSITISEDGIQTEEEENKSSDFRAWERIRKYISPFFYTMLGLSILTWFCWAVVPSKKDCAIIIAGGTIGNFLSTDTNARQVPTKAFALLNAYMDKQYDELLSDSEKSDLGIKTSKDEKTEEKNKEKSELLDKIKDMTKDEIIKYLQNDE